MNAKKAKLIRKALRSQGINVTEHKYVAGKPPMFAKFGGFDAAGNAVGYMTMNPLGDIIRKVSRGQPTVLAACGRDIYRGMKKEMKLRGVA